MVLRFQVWIFTVFERSSVLHSEIKEGSTRSPWSLIYSRFRCDIDRSVADKQTDFILHLLKFTSDPHGFSLEVLLDEELPPVPAASEAQSSAAALAEGEKTPFLPLLILLST